MRARLAAIYVSSLAFDRKTLQPVSLHISVRRSSTAPARDATAVSPEGEKSFLDLRLSREFAERGEKILLYCSDELNKFSAYASICSAVAA